MHAAHLHPRHALLAAIALLVVALLALMPAALEDASFGLGEPAALDTPAVSSPAQAEPSWHDNPFAWPLLQKPAQG